MGCLYLLQRGNIDVLICDACLQGLEPKAWDIHGFQIDGPARFEVAEATKFVITKLNGPYYDLHVRATFDARVLAAYEGDDRCWICGEEVDTNEPEQATSREETQRDV